MNSTNKVMVALSVLVSLPACAALNFPSWGLVQLDANRKQSVTAWIKDKKMSAQDVQKHAAHLKEVEKAYAQATEKTKRIGFDYKILPAAVKKSLGLEKIDDRDIALMATVDRAVYQEAYNQLYKDAPIKAKLFNGGFLKKLMWGNRTGVQKAGIIVGSVAGLSFAALGVKKALFPATYGERNMAALDEVLDIAQRLEDGAIVLDEEMVDEVIAKLTLLSDESCATVRDYLVNEKYAELYTFVEEACREQVLTHDNVDQRDGLVEKIKAYFHKNDEDDSEDSSFEFNE